MEKKIDVKYVVNSCISLLIMICFRFIPLAGQITDMGMAILGIMLGAVYAWCTVDIVWPSIVALVLLGFTGFATVPAVFQSAISNQTVLLVFFLFLFNGLLEATGVAKTLAQRLVSTKMANGRPWRLYVLILFAAYVTAMVAGLAAAVMIWPVVYNIVKDTQIEKNNKWVVSLIFGIMLASSLGGCLLPFQAGVQAIYGVVLGIDPTAELPYLPYIIFGLVFAACVLGLYTLFVRFVLRPDTSALKNYEATSGAVTFTWEHKFTLILFAIMAVALVGPSLLPKTSGLYAVFANLGNFPIVALAVVVALAYRRGGKPVVTLKALTANVPWGILFMLAAAITVSSAMTSAETGITATILAALGPVLNNTSSLLFLIVGFIITIVVTNFISNSVVGFTIIPLIYTMAMGIGGIKLMPLVALLIYMDAPGFLLPSGSPGGAMMYANKEWLSAKNIMFFSAVTMVVYVLVGTVVGLPLLNAIM